MFFTGHKESVLDAIRGGAPKVALFAASGMMRGSFGAGVMCALNEKGCDKSFSIISGCSTGAPPVAYLKSGNPQVGATIYWQECCLDDFLLLSRKREACNMQFLKSIWEGATGKGLHVDRVLKPTPRLVVVVVDAESGKLLYITPRTEGELLSVLAGGAASPRICTDEFFYQGKRIMDAVDRDPLPIKWLMSLPERERPSHILVIANRPCILRTDHNNPFIDAAKDAVERTDVEVTVCWMQYPPGITLFERRREVVRSTVEYARSEWVELLS